MADKDQFMVSVDPNVRDRLDALRIVMGVSRAEVNRQALVRGGLRGLEAGEHPRLNRLYGVASRYKLPWETFVRRLIDNAGRTPLPNLEQLEELDTTTVRKLIGAVEAPA